MGDQADFPLMREELARLCQGFESYCRHHF